MNKTDADSSKAFRGMGGVLHVWTSHPHGLHGVLAKLQKFDQNRVEIFQVRPMTSGRHSSSVEFSILPPMDICTSPMAQSRVRGYVSDATQLSWVMRCMCTNAVTQIWLIVGGGHGEESAQAATSRFGENVSLPWEMCVCSGKCAVIILKRKGPFSV